MHSFSVTSEDIAIHLYR